MKITQPKFVRSEKNLCSQLARQLNGRRFVLLMDEMLSENFLSLLTEFLGAHSALDIIEVESGEACKAPEVCFNLWAHLLELGFTKSDVLVCVGGGSICDLGGFVAATFKRGTPCIFIPTTLLAMTDAAIGGKNGIDLGAVKNAVGSIVQPEAIIIYPSFCSTLTDEQYMSGMAEIYKHALIDGGEFWRNLSLISPDNRDIDIVLLRKSIRIKLDIVRKDVSENGLRKILNFGHTIGHAVEAACRSDDTFMPHGVAVAFGMLVESNVARKIGLLGEADYKSISHVLKNSFKKLWIGVPEWNVILPFLRHDKKADFSGTDLFLPRSPGNFEIFRIDDQVQMQVSYNEVVESIALV